MKLRKSLLSLFALVLFLSVPQFSSAAGIDKKSKEGPIIVRVGKEEAQRLRVEAGLPFDDKVTGGFYVYPEGEPITDDSGLITPAEWGKNEYYVLNDTTSYRTDFSEPYLPGSSGCNMTLTASASFAKVKTITGSTSFSTSALTFLSAQVSASYAVGETITISNSGSKQVTGCKTLIGYPRYQETTGDLWEEDVWFNDYIGDYKVSVLHTIYFEEKSM